MSRWTLFIVAILLGAALGLLYGWRINPVEYIDASPDTLRDDYKTDYVLMVAESFNLTGDTNGAVRRLALLGDLPPDEIIFRAILFAEERGYSIPDQNLMRNLLNAVKANKLLLETPQP